MKLVKLLLVLATTSFLTGCDSSPSSSTSSTSEDSSSEITSSESSSSTSEDEDQVTIPVVYSFRCSNSYNLEINCKPEFEIGLFNPDIYEITYVEVDNNSVTNFSTYDSEMNTIISFSLEAHSNVGTYSYELTNIKCKVKGQIKKVKIPKVFKEEVKVLMPNIKMWTGLGSTYSSAFNNLVNQSGYNIKYESRGSYDRLVESIQRAAQTNDHPLIANGREYEAAIYENLGIVEPLEKYINEYNLENNTEVLDDYYEEYLKPFQSIAYDDDYNPLTRAIPFFTSKDVMVYNGYFVDYAIERGIITDVPKTWQEWAIKGPSLRALQLEMNGKYLHASNVSDDGHASGFTLNDISTGSDVVLDMHEVSSGSLLSYDNLSNLFIELVTQWGGDVFRYTPEDAKNVKHGYVTYNNEPNKEKTIEALTFLDGLFGTSDESSVIGCGGGYITEPFKSNAIMFAIVNSGGLTFAETGYERIAPIPYYDDGINVRKTVITNPVGFSIFTQGKEQNRKEAFNAITTMTSGSLSADWSIETGFYPVTKSASKDSAYQDYLNSLRNSVYLKSARINENEYMGESKNWEHIYYPSFEKSAFITNALLGIISACADSDNTKTIQEILDDSYTTLSQYGFVLN